MSLSLEVRKFINSEHIGDFVTVTLPGELPVEHEEIRTVRRDKAAADRALRTAQERADALKHAEQQEKDAGRELRDAKDELVGVEKLLSESSAKYEALTPDFNEKKAAMETARKEYNEKKTESDRLEADRDAAEARLATVKSARKDAEDRISTGRFTLESAKAECASAEAEVAELDKQYAAAKEAAAEAELNARKAADEAEAKVNLEAASEAEYNRLKEESVSLSIEKRVLEKQLAEAQSSEARANRDYQKAQSETELAEKQYEALKNSTKKRDSEKDAMRLAQAKSKLDTAVADEKVRLANYEKEQDFLRLTKEKMTGCERSVVENEERLEDARKRRDEAKQDARRSGEAKQSEELKLSGRRAEVESLMGRLESARKHVADTKKTQADSSAQITTAEGDIERSKGLLETAENDVGEKKNVYDAAKTITDAHERLFSQKRSEFDRINTQYEDAKRELDAATGRKKELEDRIALLEVKLTDCRNRLEDAQEDSRSASSEAQRLKDSIHIIETKYETARVHYIESGKGEPIILVHTAGQSLYTFRSLFYKLAMNYRVIAFDLVGHGYSDRPDFFDYGLRDHAESIARFMDALGIESAHVLGFSMGAGFALEFAKLHPERVGRVIAITPGGITGSMPLSVRLIESGIFGPIASRTFRMRTVEKMLHDCVFDHTVIGDHDVKEYYRPASDPDGRFAIRRTVAGFDEDELASALHEVEAPVLVIWGDDDKWHPVDNSNLYRSSLPSAALTIVRNAGHLVHEEKPDRIYELIRSFIPAGYGNDD